MGHRIRIESTGEGTSILQALQAQGEYILAPCGGNGTCGKCRVRFVQDPPAPSQADRKVLTEAEISEGVRLACRTAAVQGAVIEIEAGDEKQMDVASGFALGPGKEDAGTRGIRTDAQKSSSGTKDPCKFRRENCGCRRYRYDNDRNVRCGHRKRTDPGDFHGH